MVTALLSGDSTGESFFFLFLLINCLGKCLFVLLISLMVPLFGRLLPLTLVTLVTS